MRFYVDTPLVIDFVKARPPYSGQVMSYVLRVGVMTANSELTRMEGYYLARKTNDPVLRDDIDIFLAPSEILPLTRPVFELAAEIRVTIRCTDFSAIHLAAATVHQCDEFVTRQRRLARWKGVRVHVL
jgi:uncharacterized protein